MREINLYGCCRLWNSWQWDEGGDNPTSSTDVVPTNRARGTYKNRWETNRHRKKTDVFLSLWLYYQDRCRPPTRRETSTCLLCELCLHFSSLLYIFMRIRKEWCMVTLYNNSKFHCQVWRLLRNWVPSETPYRKCKWFSKWHFNKHYVCCCLLSQTRYKAKLTLQH